VFQLVDAGPQSVEVEHSLDAGQRRVKCRDIGLPVGIHGCLRYRRGRV
jgi:hypothetical protein